jgi:hypothetical protein
MIPIDQLLYVLILEKLPRRPSLQHQGERDHHRRDLNVFMMLLAVVVAFLACHFVRAVVNVFELTQTLAYGRVKHWPNWVQGRFSQINPLLFSCC